MSVIVNISAYRFVPLKREVVLKLQAQFKQKASACHIKGTILLAEEGMNLNLAGERENIENFKQYLTYFPQFESLFYKESLSDICPFKRLCVRVKKEIITFKVPDVKPEQHTAPYLSPTDFKQWYEKGKPMLVLDTRNAFEVEYGTFKDAKHLNIQHFSEFPEAVSKLAEEARHLPIVTFCTGGIRCEKAAEYMLQQGFKEVYQLEGGVLHYFEKCGGEHYQGECFVFDDRVAVKP